MSYKHFLHFVLQAGATDLEQCKEENEKLKKQLESIQTSFNENMKIGFDVLQNEYKKELQDLNSENSILKSTLKKERQNVSKAIMDAQAFQNEMNDTIKTLKKEKLELKKNIDMIHIQKQNKINQSEAEFEKKLIEKEDQCNYKLKTLHQQLRSCQQIKDNQYTINEKLKHAQQVCQNKSLELKNIINTNDELIQEQESLTQTINQLTHIINQKSKQNNTSSNEIKKLKNKIIEVQQQIQFNKEKCNREIKVNENRQNNLKADIQRLHEKNKELIKQSQSSVLNKFSTMMQKLPSFRSFAM